MRDEKRKKILDAIQNGIEIVDDLFFVFTLPYGTSMGKMHYLLQKRREQRELEKFEKEEKEKIKKEKARFTDLIYRLKKEGLVEKKKHKIILTPKGKIYLKKYSEKPKTQYNTSQDNSINLVIFDIPEDKRSKRDWIREVLKNLGYKQLQKSVWIGKNKIPEEFLNDITKQNLYNYIEIFSISKQGTLKRVKI